jgi:hypothetical protein
MCAPKASGRLILPKNARKSARMPSDPPPAADQSAFVEETLAQELGRLTLHLARCKEVWHQASHALQAGDLAAQNRALDELILCREEWLSRNGNED